MFVEIMNVNGLEFTRCFNGSIVARFLTPTGWRKATIPEQENIQTVSLPYRDMNKPGIWYVDINRNRVSFT